MIKFEILESLKFRGGNHYCDIYADSPDDVTEALKDAWYGSGLARHGGELFLYVCLVDADGKEAKLFLGNCNFDKKDKLYFNVDDLYSDEDYEPWYSFGIFSVDSSDDIANIFAALFDYDSPDRVLGSYIFKVSLLFDSLSEEHKLDFDLNIFANILHFGQEQGKLFELSQWIFSENGLKKLDEFAYCIDMESPEILALSKASKNEELEAFIKKYKKDFGVSLYLPSSL